MNISAALSVRMLLVLCAFVSAVAAPPWVPFLFALVLALRFPAWEVIILGLCIDLAWLPVHVSTEGFPLATILGIFLVWVLEPVRRELLESGPMRFMARPLDLI